MILLDGIEYDVKTPAENTDDLVTYVNSYCQSNNVKNSLGEVIHIEANEANPFYQLFSGLGYLTSIMQKLIYNAGCGISLAESSPRQLLNLSDIAGIKRTRATRTVIRGTVYANYEDAGAVPCVITPALEATIVISGNAIVFHPAYGITLQPGESSPIILIAEEYGTFNIAANTITQFDEPLAGFRKMDTLQSSPGQDEESIASLRVRLQRRTVEGTQVERAASAIQNLEGISLCNIYFNYSSSQPENVTYGSGTIAVPPRAALVLVQGWSEDIAKVFYRYMLCRTVQPENVTYLTSTYVTKADQEMHVYVIPPNPVPICIRVYINDVLSSNQVNGIKDIISSLAGSLSIGQTLDAVDVTDIIKEHYSNLEVQGAELSLTGVEGTYSYKQNPGPTGVFTLSFDNIEIVGREAL